LEFAALALAVLAVLLPCIVLYRMKRKGIIKSNVIVTHTWVMLALYVFGLAVTTIVINNLIYN
jgi:hypothetical protein